MVKKKLYKKLIGGTRKEHMEEIGVNRI